MRKVALVVGVLVVLVGLRWYVYPRWFAQADTIGQNGEGAAGTPVPPPEVLDHLLAPIALYPDQLLAQMLLCAMEPSGVTALDQFLKGHPTLKGTELQDAALKDNFEPSYVAMALFPQIISTMASQLETTTRIGRAFAANKTAVFTSIQRLRRQAHEAGNLTSTPQQNVETETTSTGDPVIVIEPANPQVIYVPQYNTETVYVQQPAPSVVVVEQDHSDAVVAGVIGFTAGVVIGAAISTPHYYGPYPYPYGGGYGWRGGAYMYNEAWDDYYDHREDAREDWMDHREDVLEDRGDRREDVAEDRNDRRENTSENRTERRENTSEQRTDRQENRTDTRADTQQQRTDRQQTRPESQSQSQTQRAQSGTGTPAASTSRSSTSATTRTTRTAGSYESRGFSQGQGQTSVQQRSGTRSDAFTGYSSGRSESAASSRGTSSRSSSRSSGSRSGGGGGRRR